jgi:hypothetical protein
MSKRKPNGYWTEEKVIETYKNIAEELGRAPTKEELEKRKLDVIPVYANKYFGGLNKLAEESGYQTPTRSNGYWKNKENCIKEYKALAEKIRRTPTATDINDAGLGGLLRGMHLFKGSHGLAKAAGYEPNCVQSGFWKKQKNILKYTKALLKKHKLNTLPGEDILQEMGESSLAVAISEIYGFHKFRNILGEEQKKVKDGSWKSLNFTINYARNLMKQKKLKELPSGPKLCKMGESGFVSAVLIYHGGMHVFREILGEEQKQAKSGSRKDLNLVLNYAIEFMKKNKLNEFPTQNKLRSLDEYGLASAIDKYHGGFIKFRQLVNERIGVPSEKERLEKLVDGYLGEKQ